MTIHIQVIPNDQQKYLTVGNWTFLQDDLLIEVSDMGDWKKEVCVAFHEMFEALSCKARGISEEDVTAFDIEFENNRTDDSEPGNHPDAPYKQSHFKAEIAERLLADELSLDWSEYEQSVLDLS